MAFLSIRKSVVFNNSVALFFVQFSNYLAPLLVLPYLSRILGVDGFGIIVMAMSLCNISFIFTDYGFSLSGAYWIAKNRDNSEKISYYISAVFGIKIIITLLTLFFLYLFYINSTVFNGYGVGFFILISASIFSQAYQSSWFFQGIEKMRNVTIFMVTSKLLYLFFVFIFVTRAEDIYWVLGCLALSNFIAAVISIYYIYKEGFYIRRPALSLMLDTFKDSTSFFISRAAVGIYTSASTFIVGSFSGIQQAALYSAAEKLYQAGQGVTSPISQALFPYLSRTGDKRALYKFVTVFFIPLVIGCVFFACFSSEVLTLFYGKSFSAAETILRVFLICSLVNFVSVNFGYPAYSIINRLDIANKSVICAAAAHLIMLSGIYLFFEINALTVSFGVLLVETIVMLVRVLGFIYLTRRK
ncbi:oligosaccharide flippase family protein [Citrobacter braakii]|uniref:oligosaccharide flippase family protein n=1 Tax=Citrobacter braakii TaxID=57706 RepID=UPI0034E4AA43